MKTIRIAALGAALVVGVAASATAQPPMSARPDRAAAGDSVRARRHGDGAGRQDRAGGMQGSRALMRGIELSDAQQAQVRAIHAKYAQQRQSLAPQARGGVGDQRARPDSATRAQARSLMEHQMAEVRGVLSADQQRTFDGNTATLRERGSKRQAKLAKRDAKVAKQEAKTVRKRPSA